MVERLLSILLVSFLLAGCSGAPASPDTSSTAPSSSFSAAPAQQAPAEPALLNATASCDGQRTAIGSGMGYGVNYDAADICHFDPMFDLSPTLYSAGLVEVTWTALSPTATDVRASIQSRTCADSPLPDQGCALGSASGTSSPLRIELDGETLAEHGGNDLAVLVGVTGAAAQQPFTVYVTLFNTGRIPSGYTAVP